MSAKEKRLEKLRRALEKWRAAGRPGRKIPRPIWSQAVELAAEYGVSDVSKAGGLDYTKLKNGVAAHGLVPADPTEAPTFVEFVTAALPQALSCVVEIRSVHGGQMRAEVSGLDAAGFSALCREFGNL